MMMLTPQKGSEISGLFFVTNAEEVLDACRMQRRDYLDGAAAFKSRDQTTPAFTNSK